ncbi:MAG: polysaccharide biosynthesis tyrosine autokinase [Thermodesulfovibrionales bacterium]
MSKIEKALEKAVQMRETKKESIPDEVIASDNRAPVHQFQVGEAVIDTTRVDGHIVCITDPLSSASEQFKKLKARILNETTKQDFLNTIMVTSSDIGEGKSIVAINLAIVLSHEIDHTVLLIDADLRNPSIHKYFGIEPEFGLSDYLTGKVNLADIFIKTGLGKLVLIPAGNIVDNSAELLSSEKMKLLVRDLKLRYRDRYIIFDSTPLLVTADPLMLGSYMDGIIFVIQEGRTAQKSALQSFSLIKGWNILGVVFNNVPPYLIKSHDYYYYPKKSTNNGKTHADMV